MSSSTSTPLSLPTGLAPVARLPLAAHAVLHRELFHIHSSLRLILLILRGPWDTVTPALADTITCPRLSASLCALQASIEQIKRATCATLVNTDQLFDALGLLHPTHRLTAQLRDQATSLDTPASPPSPSSFLPRLILSPPSPTGSSDAYFDNYHWTTSSSPRGCSTFPDPRLPSFPAPLGSTTTETMTCTRSLPTASPRPPTIRTPRRPVINRSSTAPSRSRSNPLSNSRNL